MFKRQFTLTAVCVLSLAPAPLATGAQRADDTRALVRHLAEDLNDEQAWARLFLVGDDAISDLIVALDDPDSSVSATAQRMIRYLGNPRGMQALVERYARVEPDTVAGPVPVPLTDWDYELLEQGLAENERTGRADWGSDYLYALALDPSPESAGDTQPGNGPDAAGLE